MSVALLCFLENSLVNTSESEEDLVCFDLERVWFTGE